MFEGRGVFGRGEIDRLQGGCQLPAVQQAWNRRVEGLNVGQVLQEGRRLQVFYALRTVETQIWEKSP